MNSRKIEDGKIIINPYSTLSDAEKDAVRKNEAVRLYLRDKEVSFNLTEEQKESFKDYSDNENDIKSTLIGRYLSGDPSTGNLTKEQLDYIKSIKKDTDKINVTKVRK